MATRNIVPRSNEEGNIGTSLKNWLKGWFKDLFVSGDITDGSTGISVTVTELDDAVTKKHTTGLDTSLGALASDINMNTHQLTTLSVPDANGEAIRVTTKITEVLLESATDLKHTQNTDTQLPITVAPGDEVASGIKIVLTSTGTFNFGDVGYIKSDGTVGFADASVIATASGLVMCADAQIASASGNWLLLGIAQQNDWNWTPGKLIYLTITGTTGNTLSETPPSATDEVVQIIGVSTHADRIFFNPQLVQIELN